MATPTLSAQVQQRLTEQLAVHRALLKTKGEKVAALAGCLWAKYRPRTILSTAVAVFAVLVSLSLGSVLFVTLFGLLVGLVWAIAVGAFILGGFATIALVVVGTGALVAAWACGFAAFVAGAAVLNIYLLQVAFRYYKSKRAAAAAANLSVPPPALGASSMAKAVEVSGKGGKQVGADQGYSATARVN